MPTETPARIPNALDAGTKLFGRFTLTDVAVALSPAVVLSLAIQVLVPPELSLGGVTIQTVALPLVALAVIGGLILVLVTPSYADSLTWVISMWEYVLRERQLGHHQARDVANVRRVWPEHDAVERTDGALLAMIEIDPVSMALATDEEWGRTAAAFGDFLDTRVEFPVQFYSTTRAVSTEEHLQPYRDRLASESVSPEVRALIEGYVEWFEADIRQRESSVREQYVVVAVSPHEVQFEKASLVADLQSLPVLGVFLDLWFEDPEPALRERQSDELRSRIRRLEAGIRGIDGCSARRLPIDDVLCVIARYWRDDDAVAEMNVPTSSSAVIGEVDTQ